MRAGELDRSITFQKNTTTKGTRGGVKDNWSDLATECAKVRPDKETEPFVLEKDQAFEVKDFTIRYNQTYDDYKLRIVYDGKFFDIISIKELGRREGLKIKGKAKA